MARANEHLGGLPSPQQSRSRDALLRLLAAGERLLEDHAFESASVADVAALAGSSVGSFYRLIGNKADLLRAIHERFLADSHDRLDVELAEERFAGRSPEQIARGYVDFLVDVYARREGLLRALIVRSSAEPEFREGVHLLNATLEDKLAALLAPQRARIGHPRPNEAIRFGVAVVLGALNQHTLAGAAGAHRGPALARELARVLCSYLALDLEGEGPD